MESPWSVLGAPDATQVDIIVAHWPTSREGQVLEEELNHFPVCTRQKLSYFFGIPATMKV